MTDMAASFLSINYDGPILENGEMDIADLAPALLAMGKLFEEANRVINGDKSTLSVRVRAGFQKGSFEVELHLLQGWIAYARDILAGSNATALANLCAFLGISGGGTVIGLFKLLRIAKGRQPIKARVLEDGNIELEFPDEAAPITVPHETVQLFRDVKVRKAASAAVKPLEREGIESISVRETGKHKDEAKAVVLKKDLLSFRAPDGQDTLIIDSKSVTAFSIINLSFNDEGKWKLSDGQNIVWASIEDDDFVASVDRNEISFTKGDILLCEVVVQQWQTDTGLKTDTKIVKVLEHRHPSSRQIALPFS